jgi:hypothetical protein
MNEAIHLVAEMEEIKAGSAQQCIDNYVNAKKFGFDVDAWPEQRTMHDAAVAFLEARNNGGQ